MQPTSPAEQVAANVRAELGRHRKSQSDLGQALGLTQSAVARRLSGKVAFDINEISTAAVFLSVPVASLLASTVAGSAA